MHETQHANRFWQKSTCPSFDAIKHKLLFRLHFNRDQYAQNVAPLWRCAAADAVYLAGYGGGREASALFHDAGRSAGRLPRMARRYMCRRGGGAGRIITGWWWMG